VSWKLSHKLLALGTAVFLVSFVALMAFLIDSYSALQAFNPIAALTAITVAVIGIAWFKKTNS
jgi:hypothetical protein